jgi:hypothetical protein
MSKMKRATLWLVSLFLFVTVIYGCKRMTAGWETITTTFLRDDKPYGGGAFRIRGNEVISLKVAGPQITFKPLSEQTHIGIAEPTEAWMNNTSELLNRKTISFMHGTITGGLKRTFQERGQRPAWWYSKDWQTIYISTGWMDYKAPRPANALSPQITKLWRSGDGGETWTQLAWPENDNIEHLMFLDAQRGYAVGWGPHVWRTADGGQSWQEVEVPPLANVGGPRQRFSAVNLGPDGVLRVAYYVEELGDVKGSSLVYRLGWSQATFERDVVLPDQIVVDLQSPAQAAGGYAVYALSKVGPPRDYDNVADNGHRVGLLSEWESVQHPDVRRRHSFDKHLRLDGLSVGCQGVLLVYATDATGNGAPRDLTFISKTFGKSWDELNDGLAQGGYFDPETNTQYTLIAYTLKKRTL